MLSFPSLTCSIISLQTEIAHIYVYKICDAYKTCHEINCLK